MKNEPSDFELTTELLMVKALERGLTLNDFNDLTIGMIVGYITTFNDCNNEQEDQNEIEATQANFDTF